MAITLRLIIDNFKIKILGFYMIKRIKICVSGLVQGVGFRFFTYQQAQKLGLLGYVKNLDNGNVEIVIQGDNLQLTQFTQWLLQGGPASAHITDIKSCELLPENGLTSFNVRY